MIFSIYCFAVLLLVELSRGENQIEDTVLNFTASNIFPPANDTLGQFELRNSRFWGRLYINGWPQTIQYFRAHFGSDVPYGQVKFIFAEPRNACSTIQIPLQLQPNTILLAHRGVCSFGAKAKFAAATANVAGLLIINNEPGLEHLHGPDAQNVGIHVSELPMEEGNQLEEYYNRCDSKENCLSGYMIPINCNGDCAPATIEEQSFARSMN